MNYLMPKLHLKYCEIHLAERGEKPVREQSQVLANVFF